MALTNWNDILNKPKGIEEAAELELQVQQLSASVLSISEDVGEIALDVSQLSASVLPMASDNPTTIKENIDNIKISYPTLTFTVKTGVSMTVQDLRSAKVDGLTLVVLRLLVGDDFSANAEYEIGNINEKVSTNIDLINGVITRRDNSKMVGTFNISSKKLFIHLNENISYGMELILTFTCITE